MPDCQEGEDEEEEMCLHRVGCNSTQWECQLTGQCVDLSQVCDGHRDCQDGTDEHDCPDHVTPPADCVEDAEHFLCDNGDSCVHWDKKCDGYADCLDGSDEDFCQHWKNDMAIEVLEERKELTTHNSVSVIWRLFEKRDSLEYKYSWRIHGQSNWTNVSGEWHKNENREYTFTNLNPYTHYDVRLYARDSKTSKEFSHAPVLSVLTGEFKPSPPQRLAATQQGDKLLLTWDWPTVNNGQIKKFKVRLYRDGNLLREITKAALKEEDNLTKTSQNFTLYGLEFHVDYMVTVLAVNSAYESNPSKLISAKLVDSVGPITVEDTSDRSVRLSWASAQTDIKAYLVCSSSENVLEKSLCRDTFKPNIFLTGLSPNTKYNITVQAQVNSASMSAHSEVRVLTTGRALPVPAVQVGQVSNSEPTDVKISWTISQTAGQQQQYQFGVFKGTSLSQLYKSSPSLVRGDHLTLSDLRACTDYIFGVAVFDTMQDKAGIGRMSSPVNFMTGYTKGAAPRNLTVVNNNTVRWTAPCDDMKEKVRYTIKVVTTNIYNEGNSPPSLIHLEPVDIHMISHTFPDLDTPGAKYAVSVSNADGSKGETSPVYLYGPELPRPTSVYTHPTDTGGFLVSWAPGKEHDQEGEHYEVVLSPDPQFRNETCNIILDMITNTSTRISQDQFKEACHHVKEYYIAVRTVFKNRSLEFKSAFSKSSEYLNLLICSLAKRENNVSGNGIMMLDLTEPGTIVIKEKSAVGSIIGVLIVIILMGGGIAYYAHTNRRMRNRFREFIATHYNSATGHATINHHGLIDEDDDDDSPIIRGFNDEEPLVM